MTSSAVGDRSSLRPADMTIDGNACVGLGHVVEVENPATGATLTRVPIATTEQVDAAIEAARGAFDSGRWSELSPARRSTALHRLADLLEEHLDELVGLAVQEVGTPISTARNLHGALPLRTLRWYADAAARARSEALPLRGEGEPLNSAEVNYLPVGVVSAITPYNYPLFLACQKAAAALAAGCTVVLMPSPLTPLVTLRLGELAREALPPGVLNTVVGDAEAGRLLSSHASIDAVTFTGSVPVGTQIVGQAAATIKSLVLELGGKSANILLPGTDLSVVVPQVHARYLRNAGQGCASPTRLLVEKGRYEEFCELSRAAYDAAVLGDPADEATLIGPVVSAAHRERVEGYVRRAVEAGGELIAGSLERPPQGHGWFVSPALIGGIANDSELAREEVFGPVAVVLPYDDVEEAVALANDSDFALSGNVYGPTVAGAIEVARRIRSGHVTVNGGSGMRPDAPFGGLRLSGVGREGGEWGIRAFLEPQLVQWPV